MIMDKWRENQAAVEQAGKLALEAARKAGVAADYIDPALSEGIVKEMPDGARYFIEIVEDREVIVEPVGPRG